MARRVDPKEGASGPRTTSSTAGSSSYRSSGGGGMSGFVPVLTLLLGLVLGAGGMWFAAHSGAGVPGIAGKDPSVTAPPTPGPAPTTVNQVQVPASCLQIADESQQLSDVVSRGLLASKDLDAATLSGIVREFGDIQQSISSLAADCREKGSLPEFVTSTN